MARVLAGVLALALASSAFADDPAPGPEGAPSGDATPLAPVVVPLPPAPAPESPTERDPTGMVTLIPVAQRRTQVQEASELLALAPSLELREGGGLGQAQQLTLRGASSLGVRVMLDGIPLEGAGGVADLSLLPLPLIERIEIARGPSGARYGGGALGGVVNLVTVAPGPSPTASAQLSAGSFGSALGQVDVAGPLGGGEALLLVHGQRSDGDFHYPLELLPSLPNGPVVDRTRENNRAGMGGALAKYRRRLGAFDVSGMADFLSLSRGLAGTAQNPTPHAHEATWRALGSVRASRDFDSGLTLTARASFTREHSRFDGGLSVAGEQTFDTLGAEATARLPVGLQAFTATVDAGRDALTSMASSQSPSWGRVGAMLEDDALLFAQRLAVSASARVDRAGQFVGVSPKLGATVFLPAGFELHANAGLTYRPPSFLELYVPQGTLLPNPDLQPEEARSLDLALVRGVGAGRVSAGGFVSDYRNLISYELYAPFLAKPYNFAGARVMGLELEGTLVPAPWLSVDGSYTLTGSRNLRDDPRYYGKVLPYQPTHRLGARIELGPERVRGFAALLYTSSQFTNRAQTQTLDPAARVDLGVSAQLTRTPALTATVALKNVTDVHTFGFDGYPLPGRAAFATLAIALGDTSPTTTRNTP